MIRVLHIISGLGVGGAENALLRLLQGSPRDGYQVRVIALRDGGYMANQFRSAGFPVDEIGVNRPFKILSGIYRMFKIAWHFRPHIIHGWMNHGNVAATIIRSLVCFDAKLVWGIRQTVYDIRLEKFLTRLMVRIQAWCSVSPEVILFNSRLALDQHIALGFKNQWMDVVANGFDVGELQPSSVAGKNMRSRLGIKCGVPVVAIVGRFHPMKDHATFIKAIALVSKAHSDLHVLLVGRELDNPNSGLVELIREFKLVDICHFLGERRDLGDIYPVADVMCLSSAWGEGFPNVLGEAMACGVPCVTTDVGDSSHVVGDTGYVVLPRDPQALASAIGAMLNLPELARSALGLAARDRIVKEFSTTAMVDRYLDTYEKVLAHNVTSE